MKHIKLKVGTIRQRTDEVRKLVMWNGIMNYPNNDTDHLWHKVQLVGHKILLSDLMVAEFRREVAVD